MYGTWKRTTMGAHLALALASIALFAVPDHLNAAEADEASPSNGSATASTQVGNGVSGAGHDKSGIFRQEQVISKGGRIQRSSSGNSTHRNGSSNAVGRTNSSTRGSRSVSFTENGKTVSITDDSDNGITVTTTEMVGDTRRQNVVRAANAEDLKKHPEAHRLYDRHLGKSQGKATAIQTAKSRAFGGGRTNKSGSRSISISENGKNISITEDADSGISVTVTEMVNGKERKTVVKAADAEKLKKKSAEAFRHYKRYLGETRHAGALDCGPQGGPEDDALRGFEDALRRIMEENADNPQMQQMLEDSLRQLKER